MFFTVFFSLSLAKLQFFFIEQTFYEEKSCKPRNLTLSRFLAVPVLPSLLTFFTFLLFYFSTSKPSVLLKKKGAQ